MIPFVVALDRAPAPDRALNNERDLRHVMDIRSGAATDTFRAAAWRSEK